MHKINIPQPIIDRVVARRGKLHMFRDIEPAKTAHVIVDLQNGFMAPGAIAEIAEARDIVPNVNRISAAVRAAGGVNVFIQNTIDDSARQGWSNWFGHFSTPERRARMDEAFAEGSAGHAIWPHLEVEPTDLRVLKRRFSAFVSGSSDLHEILQARGVDTLIITGTATNVCCESTARDAMMMNYKVIFAADGNATYDDAIHNATLSNMVLLFADVLSTDEIVDDLARAGQTAAVAAEYLRPVNERERRLHNRRLSCGWSVDLLFVQHDMHAF